MLPSVEHPSHQSTLPLSCMRFFSRSSGWTKTVAVILMINDDAIVMACSRSGRGALVQGEGKGLLGGVVGRWRGRVTVMVQLSFAI